LFDSIFVQARKHIDVLHLSKISFFGLDPEPNQKLFSNSISVRSFRRLHAGEVCHFFALPHTDGRVSHQTRFSIWPREATSKTDGIEQSNSWTGNQQNKRGLATRVSRLFVSSRCFASFSQRPEVKDKENPSNKKKNGQFQMAARRTKHFFFFFLFYIAVVLVVVAWWLCDILSLFDIPERHKTGEKANTSEIVCRQSPWPQSVPLSPSVCVCALQ
jgi:hypothetical protein